MATSQFGAGCMHHGARGKHDLKTAEYLLVGVRQRYRFW